MINLYCWPPDPFDTANGYLPLYHRSLVSHGIAPCAGLRIDDGFLRSAVPCVHAMQFHWSVEEVWRRRGRSALAKLRGVVGLWRYLRLARQLGVGVIWTVHNTEHHEGAGWVDQLGYRVLANAADLVISHSAHTRAEVLRRYGGRPERALVMKMGNYDGYYPSPRDPSVVRHEWGIPGEARFLLCCGLMRPYKAYELAVQAVARLGPPYRLLLCGPAHVSDYADRLRAMADKTDNVSVVPRRVTEQDVADLHAACDCVLLPYRKITGSSAALAALTFGRGFVASDLPCFRELVEEEPLAGVLFPSGQAGELESAIAKFFLTPAGTRNSAARHLAEVFAWEDVILPVAEWIKQHTNTIAGRSSRQPTAARSMCVRNPDESPRC
jgi:glycosyltransferase involved in cell wall biosynthesis